MILHLNQVIDDKALDDLINAYNSLRSDEQGNIETLRILFSSQGGMNSVAGAMVKLINDYADITTMVGYSHLYSNGFRIFFDVECEKELLDGTRGMYHLTRTDDIMLYEGGVTKNSEYDDFVRKEMKSFNYLEYTHKLVNFTEAEISDIKNNKDVWFTTKRLEQMLKYNKSLKNKKPKK